MNRFDLLEKEINKGISVDEKSNQVINGWSPNNVRRLIIGFDFAIVQYFVTGGKYTKLVEIIDFRKVAESEVQHMQENPTKYKSILGVLTKGRICSSVEEIIFCSKGYPEPILMADVDLKKLSGSSTSAETRFSRLRHVSIVDMTVQEMSKYVSESKKPTHLLLTHLDNSGVSATIILDQHEEDWWKSSSLRPKYYAMDNSTLPAYFEKVKETLGQSQREDMLKEIEFKKSKEILEKSIVPISQIISIIGKVFTLSDEVFDASPLISKAEWSSVLQKEAMYKGIRKELMKKDQLVIDARKIDFEKIVEAMETHGVSENRIGVINQFKEYLFAGILQNEEAYKRESNKDDIATSIQTIKKVAGLIFTVQVNIVYLSLARYLTRNTPENIPFFYKQLGVDLSELLYTRAIVEYCNRHMQDSWAKEAFAGVTKKEVLVEEFVVPKKFNNVQIILKSFHNTFN